MWSFLAEVAVVPGKHEVSRGSGGTQLMPGDARAT